MRRETPVGAIPEPVRPAWTPATLLAFLLFFLAGTAAAAPPQLWVMSSGGTDAWTKLGSSGFDQADLRFGDFDGNGKTDIFRTTGGKWYVSTDGVEPWRQINASSVPLYKLHFGDFDGNGKTDVFRTGGDTWYVSTDGVTRWQQINTSGVSRNALRFGDFDGNGKTDVFRSESGKWYVSKDGTGPWQQINASGIPVENLRFADFDGNGKTDVFRTGGGRWYVSKDGTGPWQTLNTSGVGVSKLLFGDFDGNGKSDVFRTGSGSWYVSKDGTGAWQRLRRSSIDLARIDLGDFDGDGKADVFTAASACEAEIGQTKDSPDLGFLCGAGGDRDLPSGMSWASLRDQTAAQLERKLTAYKKLGYMLTDFDAYPFGSALRYSMVWRENPDGRDWGEHHNLTSAEYQEAWTTYRDLGYRPIDVEAYPSGSSLRYAGIWIENVEEIDWASIRNATSASYADFFNQQRDAGNRPVDIEVYDTADGPRYAAIWHENRSGVEWAQLSNMTQETYQQELTARWKDGFRVIDFESYTTSSGQRYAAIWEKNRARRGWQVRSDRPVVGYANLWRQYADEGYRLVDFERYDTPDGPRYAGIWEENESRFRYGRKRELDNRIRNYLAVNNLPGISVAIVRDGSTLYRRGFGSADVGANKAAHGGTIYGLASVSKLVGRTLATKLETEGRLRDGTPVSLDLDDPSSFYLQDVPEPGSQRSDNPCRAVAGGDTTDLPGQHTHTVEELLSHRGCIPHYTTNSPDPRYDEQTASYPSAVAAAQSFWEAPLLSGCKIGDDTNYSTHGFTLVGAVLECASGRTIFDLVDREIGARYGLRTLRAQFSGPEPAKTYERATPYRLRDPLHSSNSVKDFIDPPHPVNNPNVALAGYPNNSWKVLGGGIESSAVDLARFGWKVLDGSIIESTNRDESMWKLAASEDAAGIAGRRATEYRGASAGAYSLIRIEWDDGLVIAILTNRTGHRTDLSQDIQHLSRDLVDIVLR